MTSVPTVLDDLLPTPRSLPRAGRLTVTLISLALLAVGVTTAAANWHLTDLKAYLAAADLLAAGGNPFDLALVERGVTYYYHYSPWFAGLFVPFTGLPPELIRVGWSVILIAASGLAIVPLVRMHGAAGLPLVALIAFLLLNLVAEGNVQPLLLAALVWSLERRAGPVAIGMAASLKITPILLALVYVGRGEWARALLSAAVAGLLVLPTLLFELTPNATETGGTGLFTSAPILWALLVLTALASTMWLARSRFGWLAASTATVLALPRLLIFDFTVLITAFPARRTERALPGPSDY